MDGLFDRQMSRVSLHSGNEWSEECFQDPKCFVIYLEYPSSDRTRIWFFKTHYIIQQISSQPYWEDIYYLRKHQFTLDELKIIKYFQFGILGRNGSIELIDNYEQNRKRKGEREGEKEKEISELSELSEVFNKQAFDQEKINFIKEKQAFEKEKINFIKERQAFEKEKREHENELAKYKNIVSNCQKEIKAYWLSV
jgi:hypothetical protein